MICIRKLSQLFFFDAPFSLHLSISILIVSLNWPYVSAGNHIFLDVWLFIQVAVHIWPSFIFGLLVNNVRVTMLIHQGFLFFLEVDLVIQDMLVIGQVLNSPLVFFRVLGLLIFFIIDGLSFSLGHNIFDLLFS